MLGISPFCVHCAYLLLASFPTAMWLVTALSDFCGDAGATSVRLTARALLHGRVRWATGITSTSSIDSSLRCMRRGPTAVTSTAKGSCAVGEALHNGLLE